jgi:SAM-dependent methyltransferase
MPGGDEIRDVQRATWAGLSEGWEKWDSVIMDQLRPVGAAIIGHLGIANDQQHLDIAAGTGEPGLTVAGLAPRGHVVLADLAAEMLGIATRRASAQGITNFETKVCSADGLPFGDAAFDSISVRWDVAVELVTRSPAQYWEMISEHASVAVAALRQLDEPAQERVAKAVIAKASTYEQDGRVRIPGVARCIAGTK